MTFLSAYSIAVQMINTRLLSVSMYHSPSISQYHFIVMLGCKSLLLSAAVLGCSHATALPQAQGNLQACGEARYLPSRVSLALGFERCNVNVHLVHLL